jgi:phosphonate transport system ATP-binding protein
MTIECKNISSCQKSALGSPILNNISCQIKKGEFVALLGVNGAGKSSLLKSLMGLIPLEKREVRINDVLLTPNNINKIRRQMAMIFQGGGLIRQLSALDNVLCGTLGFRSSWQTLWGFNQRDRLLALELLTELGVKEHAQQKVSKLSGGQRQRLGIARALLTKPKIVIFDEATSALDAETENRVSESILKLTGECTVIFIAHRLSVVRSADMIYYLDKGKIINQGTFEELRKLNADFNNQANFMGI